jgi:hypothetical protein
MVWQLEKYCLDLCSGMGENKPKKIPRHTLTDGKTLEILSPFSEENMKADAKAYEALMRHIKDVDKKNTVIMTQVENEPGCFDGYRTCPNQL